MSWQPTHYMTSYVGAKADYGTSNADSYDQMSDRWSKNVQERLFQTRHSDCRVDGVSTQNDDPQEMTWALRDDTRAILTSCYKRTFMLNTVRDTFKVRALYVKHVICASVAAADETASSTQRRAACSSKNIVYACQVCKTQATRSNAGSLGTASMLAKRVTNLLSSAGLLSSNFGLRDCIGGTLVECTGNQKQVAIMKG